MFAFKHTREKVFQKGLQMSKEDIFVIGTETENKTVGPNFSCQFPNHPHS